MTSYNEDEVTLFNAVNSIIQQTEKNWELILIFEPDDTVAQSVDELNDNRILIYQSKERMGRSRAYNYAIKRAKGTFIARMDSDDISLPNRLEQQLKYMYYNPHIDLLGTSAILLEDNKSIERIRIFPSSHSDCIKRMTLSTPLLHPTFFWRRERLTNEEFYNLEYDEGCDDLDFIFRVIIAGGHLANLSEPLIKYTTPPKYKRNRLNWSLNAKCRNKYWKLVIKHPNLLLGLIGYNILALMPDNVINFLTSNNVFSQHIRGITRKDI